VGERTATLTPVFFEGKRAAELAPLLLGKVLWRDSDEGATAGLIVETEAYLSSGDPASHSAPGPTPRNAAMFGPAGHAYVYFSYGMHFCFNVTSGPIGAGEAVLVRALEPITGTDLMARRRGITVADRRLLCGGPARLCQALAIDLNFNGACLTDPAGVLQLQRGREVDPEKIRCGPRIGIRKAAELPLRFFIESEYLSRRGPRSPSSDR
jgi:DNA-3-methyladenine glycosylase